MTVGIRLKSQPRPVNKRVRNHRYHRFSGESRQRKRDLRKYTESLISSSTSVIHTLIQASLSIMPSTKMTPSRSHLTSSLTRCIAPLCVISQILTAFSQQHLTRSTRRSQFSSLSVSPTPIPVSHLSHRKALRLKSIIEATYGLSRIKDVKSTRRYQI